MYFLKKHFLHIIAPIAIILNLIQLYLLSSFNTRYPVENAFGAIAFITAAIAVAAWVSTDKDL